MPISNIYNEAQWHWIADRMDEGYKATELGKFVGLSDGAVRENLNLIGRRIPPEERPPLEERKQEFNDLMDKGPPLRKRKGTKVVGVSKTETVFFNSMTEAAEAMHTYASCISNAVAKGQKLRGYYWALSEERRSSE